MCKSFGISSVAILSAIKPASALNAANRLYGVSTPLCLEIIAAHLLIDTLSAILALLGVLDDGFRRRKLPQVRKTIEGNAQDEERYHLADE
jgi:hypothetical protein